MMASASITHEITAARVRTLAGGGSIDTQRRAPARRMPAWALPSDGNSLFGIEAVARYLALPFLDVRSLVAAGHLPIARAGRAHFATRTDVARFILDAEAQSGGNKAVLAPAPADVGPNGCLGLVKGFDAIGAYLGLRARTAAGHSEAGHLPTFKLGDTRFARKDTLDRFAAATPIAGPDVLAGVAAISRFLAIDFLTARDWDRLGYIPTFRVRGLIYASRGDLVAHLLDVERRNCPAEFIGDPPADIMTDGAVGIVRGYCVIAGCIGIARGNVQYHVECKGLPAFPFGRVRTARRSSLQCYAAGLASSQLKMEGAN